MAESIHLDFTDLGFPGQWADLVDVGKRSPAQFERIRAKADASAIVSELVSAWRIIDPATGDDLPAPGSPELDVNKIPLAIAKRFMDEIYDRIEALTPKALRRTSGPT